MVWSIYKIQCKLIIHELHTFDTVSLRLFTEEVLLKMSNGVFRFLKVTVFSSHVCLKSPDLTGTRRIDVSCWMNDGSCHTETQGSVSCILCAHKILVCLLH